MTYAFLDEAGDVVSLREEAFSSTYRFEDKSYNGEFALDHEHPVHAGMRMLFEDDYDGTMRLIYLFGEDIDYANGSVALEGEDIFIHDFKSSVPPEGVAGGAFDYPYNKEDVALITLVEFYMPDGWTLGDVSPSIDTGEVTTYTIYKVNTPSGARLALRSAPNLTTSTVIKYYNEGTEVKYISTPNSDFFKVEAPDGKIGYMWSDYLDFYSSTSTPTAYSVNVAIDDSMSLTGLFNLIADTAGVIFTPRIEVSGKTITKYLDVSIGEPVYSGTRLSLQTSLEVLHKYVDKSSMYTTVYPITDDGTYYLSWAIGDPAVSQTKTTDSLVYRGHGITNLTRLAELGEDIAKTAVFDSDYVKSSAALVDAGVDFLVYSRNARLTASGVAADFYKKGDEGQPILYNDLAVAELPGDDYIMAVVTGLTRDYVKRERTKANIGDYVQELPSVLAGII